MATAPTEQRSTNRRIAGRTVDGEPRADFEISMESLARIREAAAAARHEAAEAAARNPGGTLPRGSRGRPPEPGSRRDVEKRTGISPRQQERFERHVALAEAHLLFKAARWKRADALKAGALLAALPPDQRPEVFARLDDLNAPDALRFLQMVVNPPRRVVPARPAQASATPSASAPASATVTGSPAPVTDAIPGEVDLQLLVTARKLVGFAAGLVSNTELCLHLRRVEADLDMIVFQLRRGAPAPKVPVARKPSVSRLLVEAKALVLQAAQRLPHPRVHADLQGVAAAIKAALLRLPSVGEES